MQNKHHRYLGLELAGAKTQKSALAVMEYYPAEQKIFLLDVYDKIPPFDSESDPDSALLEIIHNHSDEASTLAVNVPFELPPCVTCTRQICPMPRKCVVPEVKWMRTVADRGNKRRPKKKQKSVVDITPYTQRPVESWVRYQLLPTIPPHVQFDVDEALGGSRAPLTSRMNFLKRHLTKLNLLEVSPKLTAALLFSKLDLHKRVMSSYRKLDEGAHARGEILEELAKTKNIFIYERDVRKLSQSLTAFDAFVCAYTGLLSKLGECARPPKGFPKRSAWIYYPRV